MKAAALVCRRRTDEGGESEVDEMRLLMPDDSKTIDKTSDYISFAHSDEEPGSIVPEQAFVYSCV